MQDILDIQATKPIGMYMHSCTKYMSVLPDVMLQLENEDLSLVPTAYFASSTASLSC